MTTTAILERHPRQSDPQKPSERSIKWARKITEQLRLRGTSFRESYERLQQVMAEAYEGGAWELLDYPSWTAYVADVFKDEPMLLQRDAQREMAQIMSAEGMSTRAVAQVLGTSKDTVRRDIASGGAFAPPIPTALETAPVQDHTTHVAEGRAVSRDLEPAPDPVRVVTGLDGKTYKKPQPKETTKPRRDPLPPQFSNEVGKLETRVKALTRLAEDDRFRSNSKKLSRDNLNALNLSIDAFLEIANVLEDVYRPLPENDPASYSKAGRERLVSVTKSQIATLEANLAHKRNRLAELKAAE